MRGDFSDEVITMKLHLTSKLIDQNLLQSLHSILLFAKIMPVDSMQKSKLSSGYFVFENIIRGRGRNLSCKWEELLN